MDGDRFRPSPLEIASGLMFGIDEAVEPLPAHVGSTPQQALRDAVRAALVKPPCVVAFSGGRDSSALLALTTDVARREGLALPVPVTMRFPGAPATHETEWQETVISHLGLDDWVRLEFHDELDYVGPYSQQLMRRYGVRWPINDYVDLPLLEHAKTGSFIDGVDGDSVFSSSYFILLQTLRGRRLPGRTALRDLLFMLKPTSARRAEARRGVDGLPWLTRAAQDEVVERFACDIASEPVSYAKRLHWFYRSRHLAALQASTAALAADANTMLVRPLIDRTFLVALAQQVGAFGFNGRTHMMHKLFGHLLPEVSLNRKTKATFPNYWGPGSQALAADWQGEGVDPAYVDHDALRRIWSAERIDHRTALLIKSIWLARNGSGPN
jgi:hypothetical protein